MEPLMHPHIWYKTNTQECSKANGALLPKNQRSSSSKRIGQHPRPQRTMNSDKIYAAIVLAFIVFIMGTSARINSSKPKPKYEPEPLQWSVSNLNESDCNTTTTPEEWVRELAGPNIQAFMSMNADGSVTVTQITDQEWRRRWVLYPTRVACLNSISRFNHVVRP